MNWEDRVEHHLEKIDGTVTKVSKNIEETIEKGVEVSQTPKVEIPASIINIAAGTTLACLGKKGISKENTVGENIVAGTAIAVGTAAVAFSAVKLLVNVSKVKKSFDEKKLEEKIRAEIEDAKLR